MSESSDPTILVWGSNFHVRNTHMKSHQVVGEIFGHLDQNTIDNITIHDAVKLFKFDMPAPGADFPHVRNTHMKSHQVVGEIFGHLDQNTIDNITIHDAVKLFKFDMPAPGAN